MKISSCAKWILTGEHSVIRGGKAIVFPLKRFRNTVEVLPANSLSVNDNLTENSKINELIERAISFTRMPAQKFMNSYTITSNIPIGAGLGSSAALCANFVKLCITLGYEEDPISLGRFLENEFHKNSSGLDISVAITGVPLVFKNNIVQKRLHLSDMPRFTLTYCGNKSVTSECVEKVQRLFETDSVLAQELDAKMNSSSELCQEGLETQNLQKLTEGIDLGAQVFQAWGLYNDSIKETIADLKLRGALASKPIGSGLGGYIVSLWDRLPTIDEKVSVELTPGDC